MNEEQTLPQEQETTCSQTQTNSDSRKTKTSRLAILSFICGLLSVLFPNGVGILFMHLPSWAGGDFERTSMFYNILLASLLLFCIASIILGIAALIVIKRSKGKLKGIAFAILGAAFPIGYIVWMVIVSVIFPIG